MLLMGSERQLPPGGDDCRYKFYCMDGPKVNRHINFRFAARAFRHASTWWLSVVGGIIGGLILWLIGPKIPLPSLFSSNPFLANSVTIVVCVLIGVAIVFGARLIWAPIHFALEPDGGLKFLLRTRLGTQMWPILLMGAGLFSFIGRHIVRCSATKTARHT